MEKAGWEAVKIKKKKSNGASKLSKGKRRVLRAALGLNKGEATGTIGF
jgi:hypothetical protein